MKTYIRFFINKEDQTPHNSWVIENRDWYNAGFETRQWLETYPNGKVDFVNLPN